MISRTDDPPGPLPGNADFLKLMIGNSVNELGSAIGVIALTLIIYRFSHSPLLVGTIDAVELATLVVCGLPAGWVADKLPTARVLTTAAVSQALTYIALAIIVAADRIDVAALVGCVVLIGASSAVYSTTSRAAVRRVVRTDDLAGAASLVQARGALALILGAPIGGMLFGWCAWLPLALNAASFLIAALIVQLVQRRMRVAAAESVGTNAGAVTAGLTFLWKCRPLRGVTVIGIATSFASTGLLMSLIVSLQQRHYPYAVVGAVQSACAVGMVAGALASPLVHKRFVPGRHLPLTLGYIAGWFAVVAISRPSWLILGALAIGCVPVIPVVSALSAYEATVVPAGLQGRVSAADRTLTDSVGMLAPLLGGVLLQFSGSAPALLSFAGAVAAAAAYAAVDRHVRGIRLLSDETPIRSAATAGPAAQ